MKSPFADGRPQTSPPSSPVSSLSDDGDDISRPTPSRSENESRSSSAESAEKSSQRPDPNQPGWWSRLVEDSWTIELIAGFISFAAIASIVGVLCGYDQKPVPPLMKGITVSESFSRLCVQWYYLADVGCTAMPSSPSSPPSLEQQLCSVSARYCRKANGSGSRRSGF